MFFISAIELFIFDWVFFIFSSPLLKCSEFTSILFPNSVNIFITNVLNSLSGKLFISVSLFFQGLSLALSGESHSSAFSFYLTFCASVNLDEIVTCCGLEEVFLSESIHIQTACVQCF